MSIRQFLAFFATGMMVWAQADVNSTREQPGVVVPGGSTQRAVFTGGAAMDAVITDAIRKDQLPGAVVVVGHNGRIVYEKAYGFRSLVPQKEVMTTDTIFDAASLTKVIATTSAVMKLEEEGKIRLSDAVTKYLPAFQGGNTEITIRNLMTHTSGLRPDLDLKPAWSGYNTGINMALNERLANPVGSKFVYSDINFILMGEIVRVVSGQTLAEFTHDNIFAPLGMKDTMFQPPSSLLPRIAPTEDAPGTQIPLHGVVHDPTARNMGGIAGHAGLFTTAEDLAKFAEMMLGMGERNGIRIFSPLTVRAFTTVQSPPGLPLRGLGWDIDSPYANNRGDLFPVGSYGHTGFTGTSIWIDPFTSSYVILLSNAVHPHLRPAITSLRSRVATIAAAGLNVGVPHPYQTIETALLAPPSNHNGAAGSASKNAIAPATPVVSKADVRTGLDVLVANNFAPLQGRRVGLITNHTGIDAAGKRNVDLMRAAGINVTALFSPEHGIAGKEDREGIDNSTDAATGIRIWSLYGSAEQRRPSAEMLRGIDTLVFDIQDVGARFYTYTCTMLYALEEAGKHKIQFIVLDRPNPITGEHVEGPMLDPENKSFVGCFELPLRHGMTMGELAQLFNASLREPAALTVVKMENWRRDQWFDETGLPWVNPSPNMRSLNEAILYPGIAMLEASKNYSVGRGTDTPFENVGADWIDGPKLATYLNERRLPGVQISPITFRPTASNFAGKTIQGVRFAVTDRNVFNSTRLGLEVAAALRTLYPQAIDWKVDRFLIGSRAVVDALQKGSDAKQLDELASEKIAGFLSLRARYLLY